MIDRRRALMQSAEVIKLAEYFKDRLPRDHESQLRVSMMFAASVCLIDALDRDAFLELASAAFDDMHRTFEGIGQLKSKSLTQLAQSE